MKKVYMVRSWFLIEKIFTKKDEAKSELKWLQSFEDGRYKDIEMVELTENKESDVPSN